MLSPVEKRIPGRKKGSNQHKAKGEGSQNSANATDRRKVASAKASVSHDTYAKAKAIHKAAKDGKVTPDTIDKLKKGEESVDGVRVDRP